jgi:hypothetical protein
MRDPRKDIEKGIEQSIREAFAEGKFDDLEGKGKPLVLDPSPDAVVRNLLKNANVVPEWIVLASEIDRGLQDLETQLADYEREREAALAALPDPGTSVPASQPRRLGRLLVRRRQATAPPVSIDEAVAAVNRRWDWTLARHAERLHALNRKIRRFNLIVPLVDRQRHLISVDEHFDRFAERFPRLLVAPGGVAKSVRGSIPPELRRPPQKADDAVYKRDLSQSEALHQMRNFGKRPPPIG